MLQQIEFVSATESRVRFTNTDVFQLRTDRPYQWLQKACFYVLRKLQAYYIGESVTIERHILDAQTFVERIFKQKECVERFYHNHSTILLIGAEDYGHLMNEEMSTRMFTFNAEYGYSPEILGLEVHVIPWMKGCLVMPNMDDFYR